MTRTAGMIALAGAGAGLGFLFFTEKGRALQGQAKQMAMEGYEKVGETIRSGKFQKMLEHAVDQPHPDTTMAQAFEKIVQPETMNAG